MNPLLFGKPIGCLRYQKKNVIVKNCINPRPFNLVGISDSALVSDKIPKFGSLVNISFWRFLQRVILAIVGNWKNSV